MCVQFVRPPSHDYHFFVVMPCYAVCCCALWCKWMAFHFISSSSFFPSSTLFIYSYRVDFDAIFLIRWNWYASLLCLFTVHFSTAFVRVLKLKVINRIFMRRTKWKIKISNDWNTWLNSCRTIIRLFTHTHTQRHHPSIHWLHVSRVRVSFSSCAHFADNSFSFCVD